MRTLVRLVGFVAALAALTAQAAPIGDPFYVWVFGEWNEDPLDISIQTFTEAVVRSRTGGEAGESYAFVRRFGVRWRSAPSTRATARRTSGPRRSRPVAAACCGTSSAARRRSYLSVVHEGRGERVAALRLQRRTLGGLRLRQRAPDRYYPTATVSFDVEVLAGDDYPSPAVSVWRDPDGPARSGHSPGERPPGHQFRLFVESETGNLPPWVWTCDVCGQSAVGIARAELDAPYAGEIDLSDVDVAPSSPSATG